MVVAALARAPALVVVGARASRSRAVSRRALARPRRVVVAQSGNLDDAPSGYSGDGPSISDVQDLLDAAVASEDFAEAARLRDRLVAMRGDATAGVADANERFYHAFRTADAEAMRRVWGVGDHVQCLHPGSACISGADQVRESWDIVFSTMPPGAGMDVSAEQVRVHAADGWGFVTCVEKVNSDAGVGMLAATNVFEVQGDEWKIIHHHAHGLQGML